MSKNKKLAIWLVWLVVWPLSLWLIYRFTSPNVSLEGEWIDIVAFTILMCLVAVFPLIINNIPIFFIHGISLGVFLYYGLLVEVVLSQIAILALTLKLRIDKSELFRLPINMVMFICISVISAFMYKWAGGQSGGELHLDSLQSFFPIIAYVLTVFVSNQLIIFVIHRFIYKRHNSFFNDSLIWEFFTTLLMLPIGFTLYLMYIDFGTLAILFVGLPFVSVSIILNLYFTTIKMNNYLQKTSKIGHELTGQLEINEVIDLFIERVPSLAPADYILVYEVVSNDTLRLDRFYDKENRLDFPFRDRVRLGQSISGAVWERKSIEIVDSKKEWLERKDPAFPEHAESVISLPVMRDNKVVSVITLLSKQKRAYNKYHSALLDIVINYLAVALKNAKNYEETRNRSETDPLTKLFNFRYFEEYIQSYFDRLKKFRQEESLSLILIDLDHFKEINDTYGHQSGNEILKELSFRLVNTIENEGTVARYGGEEFVIFLPNTDQQQCEAIAERLRSKIADKKFILSNHILDEQESVQVSITASIGIATYPDNCTDPIELIRHADRAMYLGAKQKGRNKVAIYEKVVN